MVSALPVDVPVAPDADEAREWLEEELRRTRYQEVPREDQSSWLADLIERIMEFFESLGGEGSAPAWTGILVVIVLAALVVLLLVLGLPRLRRRSRLVTGDVFEADDERGSAAMRRDAEAAATRGEWALAIAERFRAVIRALHERTLLATVPGSTSHDVARRAAAALPDFADELHRAADDFDLVRYLGDPGDAERYARLADLDARLERARPVLDADRAPAPAGFEAPR